MKTFPSRFFLFIPILFLWTSIFSQAQTTVNFNDYDINETFPGLSHIEGELEFEVVLGPGGVCTNCIGVDIDEGKDGTTGLDDANLEEFGIVSWKISKADNSSFQFLSFWIQHRGLGSTSGTIKAFKGGVQVGSTVNINFDSQTAGLKSFASNPDFYDVDEVLIEASDFYVILDDVTYGAPFVVGDADPAEVTGINLVGAPLTTATSVDYTVTFSKNAKNVTSDDFELTTVGTIGTIGAVTGSGDTYNVNITGINGEGTIRLDLKAGTDITNDDDVDGTAAYTSGQLHYVGECFVETFETETNEATTFSGNGLNFTLGTGLQIAIRSGFGAGPSNGYIANNFTAGSFSVSSATEFTMKTIDLFLSDQTNGNNPTATGTLVIVGKKGGVDQFTITKSSGFPTTAAVNNGYFTIDFATDGAANYRDTNVDELVFTISGGFTELAIDNMNFCEAAPDVDTDAPAVNSILKVGNPISTSTAVDFQVTFDENANNVTTDDFELIKTGTATGAITGISGSGSAYTLNVTGISGEGAIQVKLLPGTDIADDLGNTPPFEYVNGELHLVGACYIENFETFLDGVTAFTSNGVDFTLGGNWAVNIRNGYGINSSDNYIENTGAGTYTIDNSEPVRYNQIAFFLSSEVGSNINPTNDGTLTIRGVRNGATEYTITKSTAFPTDFSSNNGFFYIDFATEGGSDNSGTYVDGLEIEIGGSFVYLAVDNLQFCKDFEAPTGYSVTIDQDPITVANSSAISFTFSGAELDATYNYTFSTSGGATTVVGSGTIATATDQITGIDVSSLEVGTITLSVNLTDLSGNTGDPATDTSIKLFNNAPTANAPTAPVVNEDISVDLADDIHITDSDGDDQTVTFTITGGTLTIGTTDITFGGSGNGSASFTAAGTLAAINTALDAATFSPALNLSGAGVGSISFVSNDGAVDSNTASVTFDIEAINDAPEFTEIARRINYTEGGVPANFADGGGLPLIDVDNDNILEATIDNSQNSRLGDQFTVNAPGPYTVSTVGDVITLTGNGTVAQMISAIESIDYINTTDDPSDTPFGEKRVYIKVKDASNTWSNNLIMGIGIYAVNDDPTFTGLPTDISVQDGIASNIDLSAATFGDVDSGSGDVVLSFLASTGSLSATSGNGVVVSSLGPGTMSLTGTEGAIESFLNTPSNIKYINGVGSTGDNAATLSISGNDNGNTGTGGGISVIFGSINIDVVTIPTVTSVTVPSNATYIAGQNLDFTINFSESVIVNTAAGTPELSLTIGSTERQAVFQSGSGSGALLFRYTVQPGELDNDGIAVGTLSANGGTLEGAVGNNANLTLNSVGSTTAVLVDAVAPSGYSVSIDQDPITPSNSSNVSFTFAAAESGSTYNYTFASSGGGTPVTGSGTIVTPFDQITGIDLSGLGDGTITLAASLEDEYGNEGSAATDTKIKTSNINFSVDDPIITEGNSGSSNLTFTVSLSQLAPPGGATVDYATSNGTATAGSDYTAASGTVFFATGESSKTVNISISGDETVELDETFTITLSNPTGTGVVIGDASGIGTITNDDQATVTIADVSVDENSGTAIITVIVDKAVDGGFDVDVSTADGTATTADADYTAVASQTLTFAGTAGESETFSIPLGSDTKVELDETVSISMGGLSPVIVDAADIDIADDAILTINNDDQATISIADVSGNEDDGAITVTATLDLAVQGGFTVNVSSLDGTAIAGVDYTSVLGSLIFAGTAGETQSFNVTPIADGVVEADETVLISMSGLSPTFVSASDIDITEEATVTILNDDVDAPSTPDLAASSDSGISDTDNITNDLTPTFTGTALANSTVNLSSDLDGYLGSAAVDGLGNWSFTAAVNVSTGIHSITATATDPKDNDSPPSGALSVTIDTTSPTGYELKPIGLNGQPAINTMNENDVTVNVQRLPESVLTAHYVFTSDGGGTPVQDTRSTAPFGLEISFIGNDVSGLGDGLVTLTFYMTDRAGNPGPSLSVNALKDTSVPSGYSVGWDDLIINASEASNTSFTIFNGEVGATAEYSIASSGDGYTALITGSIVLGNTVESIQTDVSSLADGTLLVEVSLTDAANNPGSPVSDNSAILDRTPPSAPSTPDLATSSDSGISDSDNITNDLTPTFNGTALANRTVTVISDVDGVLGTTSADGSGNWSFTAGSNVSIGVHLITVTQSDLAGNNSPASSGLMVTFDTQAPAPILINGLALQLDNNGLSPTITPGDLLAVPISDDYSASGDILLSLDKTSFDCSNVGSNSVTVTATDEAGNSGSEDTNVLVQDVIAPAIQAKSSVTLNVDAFGTVELTVGMVDEGSTDNCGIQSQVFSKSIFDRNDEGLNNITYTVTDVNGNDAQVNIEVTIVVVPKVLNIVTDPGQSKVYGETDPVFTYTATGFEGGDDETILTGALSRAAGENVGSYAINQGTLDAGPNYTINFTPVDFEITPATLDVTADAGQTKVYGDADPVFTYQVTGYQNGDDSGTLSGALTRDAGENVGTYPIIQGTLDAGPNYTINYTSADFEITPAILDVTANVGQSKVYGEADPVFTYMASGFKNGDTDALISGTLIRVAGEDVGMYAIQPGTIEAGSNYTINFTSADFEITPANLDITADAGQSKVYGNADPVFTYQVSGYQNGDDASILTGALARAAGEDVGSYAINLGTLSAGANYTITYTGTNFTITPRTLSITANPNQAKVYGSADPVFAYTASNFGNGDNMSILTGALSRVPGENVGMYAITLGTLDAGANYTINFISADFEIAEKVLNVTADPGQGKVFGTADPVLTYQVTGFENGDDASILTGALARAVGENVGSYAINLGSLDAGANYAINYTGANFLITKATITGITFADGTFVYDGTEKSLTISGTLPAGTSVAYTNNGRTDVGTQEVTATITGSNYNTLLLNADLTITPAAIGDVTLEDGSFVYDGTEKSLMISGTLPDGASVAYTNNARTNVGTQEVLATISGSNFNEVILTADLSITPATLMVMADEGQSKEVGMLDPELTFEATGFKGTDTEAILTGMLSRESGEEVGSYAINQGSLSAGMNYDIDFTGADFMITEEPNVDTDGDGVPDKVEEEQGTDPTDPMDYLDEDVDDVPDYVEEQQGTDPTNPGDYLDSDGDDVPDYVEEQMGTDPNNAEDFPDMDEDGIPDYVTERSITEFVAQSMEVIWGTMEEDLKVPTEVVLITSQGEFINLPVTWDLTGYEPMSSGSSDFNGSVDIPSGIFNPSDLTPVLTITVLDKPAPLDVSLSENSFIGIPDQFFQEIGAFTVLDPSDDVHTLTLPEGVQDNEFFEVIDGILFWSSAEQAQGRTDFTILLRVEDRGGNVIQKSFTITRLRTPLDQLELTNTFTPNNDGVNDTWGVPALRYYQGVRISIMEVGGNRVFYTENPDMRWDGTFDGKDMPVGAYFWIIEVEETGEVRRGVLNLLRQ
ncbi:T9SS C-terminal target domain-containing protein [Algoriphagus machipongonensis]|nr:T9SS C-terminal target domain-containing protein [Algoriphagus machipongonensis]